MLVLINPVDNDGKKKDFFTEKASSLLTLSSGL
jgi:hypothetical protein